MFGWLKRRKQEDQKFMEGLMQAAAEGDSRAKINRTLGSVGIQLALEEDNTRYCINASSAIVRHLTACADDPIEAMNDTDDKFVAGLFSFATSNYLTYIIGAPFETVASLVPLDLFGKDYASEVASLGDSFNTMTQEGGIMKAIGLNIAKWITTPTDEQFVKLVALYKLCKEHA